MSRVENKVTDILSHRACLFKQMSVEVVGFKRFKEQYKSCLDFGEIVVLKERVISDMASFFKMTIYFDSINYVFPVLS